MKEYLKPNAEVFYFNTDVKTDVPSTSQSSDDCVGNYVECPTYVPCNDD